MLEKIWHTQHEETNSAVGEVFEDRDYNTIMHRSRQCGTFVWPVRRDQGYFVMISQFQENHCLFTFLEDYKKNPAMANPWLCVSLYDEFVDRHKIALVRGAFSAPHLTREESLRLLNLMFRYYVQDNFFKYVEDFNLRPNQFDVNRHFSMCP